MRNKRWIILIIISIIVSIILGFIINNIKKQSNSITSIELLNPINGKKITFDKKEAIKINNKLKKDKKFYNKYGIPNWIAINIIMYNKYNKKILDVNTYKEDDYYVIKDPLLIIDPGHGGKDPGGGNNKYWLEKEMTLQISLYQYKRLLELGIPVTITRKNDIYLDSKTRVNIVKNSGAKYCISNHINAGGGDGLETIYSIQFDKAFAQKIADEIHKKGQNIRRVFSRRLKRNEKKDHYFMHRNTTGINTVIIEYGFADSTIDDIEQLNKNWKIYSESVVKAFCEFNNLKYSLPK